MLYRLSEMERRSQKKMFYKILLTLNGGMKPETILNDYIREYAGNVYIQSRTNKDQYSNTIKYTSYSFIIPKSTITITSKVENLAKKVLLER